ncbi:MAG TPA: hypothetical protein VGQ18_07830 [Gemmatimonadales bacterium]|jgi:hypothetical protein|nr:hypothetical protein [Gemmatimonadales bacterium]
MRIPIVAFALIVAPQLAAAQGPLPVTRLGQRTTYGSGIVAASARRVEFELTRPAHVIVLLVDPDGGIQPVFPASGERTTERAAGRQVVELNAPTGAAQAGREGPHAAPPVMRTAQQLASEGERARPSATGDDEARVALVLPYWLVITSDIATTAEEIQAKLESMNLQFSSQKAELEALARGLMARRTKAWAASYAPAGP